MYRICKKGRCSHRSLTRQFSGFIDNRMVEKLQPEWILLWAAYQHPAELLQCCWAKHNDVMPARQLILLSKVDTTAMALGDLRTCYRLEPDTCAGSHAHRHTHTLPVLRFVFGTFPLPVLALFFLFIFSNIDSFGKSAVWSVRGGSASLCVCLYSYTCLCEDQWDCFSLQSEDILSGSQIISDLQKALYGSDLIKRGRVWVTCRSRVEFSCDLKVFVKFHHIGEERKTSKVPEPQLWSQNVLHYAVWIIKHWEEIRGKTTSQESSWKHLQAALWVF